MKAFGSSLMATLYAASLLVGCNAQGDLANELEFTGEERDEMVEAHNAVRREIGASNMKLMEWDDTLEALALGWARMCDANTRPVDERIDVNGFVYVGENNIWTNETSLPVISRIVGTWTAEEQAYTLGPYPATCAPGATCGHYTQVVWAYSCKIGCGAAECDSIANGQGIESGFLVVCNYGQGGNIRGEPPYELGEPCADCPGECDEGLCPSICPPPTPPTGGPATTALPGGIGPECTNRHPLCPFWAAAGECQNNINWMQVYCQGSCNQCRRVRLFPEPVCIDNEMYGNECRQWADEGLCERYAFYMNWNCRRACGFCTGPNITISPISFGQVAGYGMLGAYGGQPPGMGMGGGGGYGMPPSMMGSSGNSQYSGPSGPATGGGAGSYGNGDSAKKGPQGHGQSSGQSRGGSGAYSGGSAGSGGMGYNGPSRPTSNGNTGYGGAQQGQRGRQPTASAQFPDVYNQHIRGPNVFPPRPPSPSRGMQTGYGQNTNPRPPSNGRGGGRSGAGATAYKTQSAASYGGQ